MVLVNNIPSPALLFFHQLVTLNRGWGFGAWSNRTCWGQKIPLEWDSDFPVLPRRHRGLRRENNCPCKLVMILYENSSSKCNLELMPLARAITFLCFGVSHLRIGSPMFIESVACLCEIGGKLCEGWKMLDLFTFSMEYHRGVHFHQWILQLEMFEKICV